MVAPIFGLIAKFAAPLLGQVFGTIDKAVKDKDLAAKLKAEIQLNAMNIDHSEFTDALKSQTEIIVAEAKGGSWLQRSWRPGLMCLFGVIIANNYILYPYLKLFFPEAPMLEIPPDMWALLKLGIGGYVVGRSGEKVVKVWKEKRIEKD